MEVLPNPIDIFEKYFGAGLSPVGCADRKEAHQSSSSLKAGKQAK